MIISRNNDHKIVPITFDAQESVDEQGASAIFIRAG